MNKVRRVRCPICREYRFPTADHIPPRCCGNTKNVKARQFAFFAFKDGKYTRGTQIFQGGLHRSFLCEECNNQLLGRESDQALGSLCKAIRDSLAKNEKETTWQGDIAGVIKAAFGHILAAVHYSPSKTAKAMRAFLKRDVVPEGLYLYLFVYPFDEIVVFLDCVSSPGLSPHPDSVFREPSGFSGLFFYPLAFLISDKKLPVGGIDLIAQYAEKKAGFTIETSSWKNAKTGTQLAKDWPFHFEGDGSALDSAAFFAFGKSGSESLSTMMRPEGFELSYDDKKGILRNFETGEVLRFPKELRKSK